MKECIERERGIDEGVGIMEKEREKKGGGGIFMKSKAI